MNIKRFVTLIFATMMLLSVSSFAVYNPPDSPDASAYFADYSARVINAGNGNLKVSFDVTGTATMVKLGAAQISIYRSTGTYVTTIYWLDSGRGGMMGSYTAYHGDMETIHVGAGSYYAVVSFYAKNSSGGIGTKTVQTATKTIT